MSSYLIEGEDGNYIDLACKIPFDFHESINEQPNVLMINDLMKDVAPFEELDDNLGRSLISPLTGQCFNHVRNHPYLNHIQKEDFWLYKFCIGESVQQLHMEPNGTISEEFMLGTLNQSDPIKNIFSDSQIDDDLATQEMMLDPKQQYLTLDSGGLLVKFFNNIHKNISNHKFDTIAIPYKVGDAFNYEMRTIIEVVNENSIIVESPFPILKDQPEQIFDFRMIASTNKQNDTMTMQEKSQHLKSFGLEIMHGKIVFCKRCSFLLSYEQGDTITIVRYSVKVIHFYQNYLGKQYSSVIQRFLEDNLMEILPLGINQKLIVVDDYSVIQSNNNQFQWVISNEKRPSLLSMGNFIFGKENLSSHFKIGDKLLFIHLNTGENLRNRKAATLYFEVVKFIDNEIMEILPSQNIYTNTYVDFTKDYLIAKQMNVSKAFNGGNQVTRVNLDAEKSQNSLILTDYIVKDEGILVFNINHKPKSHNHNLRLLFKNQSDKTKNQELEIVYNSQHGIMINDEFLEFKLFNATTVFLIFTKNNSFYLGLESLTFADIIFHKELKLQGPMRLRMAIDTQYSDGIELSQMRLIERIPQKIQNQLNFYNVAPISYKTYFTQTYLNGAVCAVNNKPRQVQIFYYCDYFNGKDFQLLELSEPDWCSYHVKVATKYMCGKGHKQIDTQQLSKVSQIKCFPSPLNEVSK